MMHKWRDRAQRDTKTTQIIATGHSAREMLVKLHLFGETRRPAFLTTWRLGQVTELTYLNQMFCCDLNERRARYETH